MNKKEVIISEFLKYRDNLLEGESAETAYVLFHDRLIKDDAIREQNSYQSLYGLDTNKFLREPKPTSKDINRSEKEIVEFFKNSDKLDILSYADYLKKISLQEFPIYEGDVQENRAYDTNIVEFLADPLSKQKQEYYIKRIQKSVSNLAMNEFVNSNTYNPDSDIKAVAKAAESLNRSNDLPKDILMTLGVMSDYGLVVDVKMERIDASDAVVAYDDLALKHNEVYGTNFSTSSQLVGEKLQRVDYFAKEISKIRDNSKIGDIAEQYNNAYATATIEASVVLAKYNEKFSLEEWGDLDSPLSVQLVDMASRITNALENISSNIENIDKKIDIVNILKEVVASNVSLDLSRSKMILSDDNPIQLNEIDKEQFVFMQQRYERMITELNDSIEILPMSSNASLKQYILNNIPNSISKLNDYSISINEKLSAALQETEIQNTNKVEYLAL